MMNHSCVAGGCRYDYEAVATDKADAVMAHLAAHIASFNAAKAADSTHGTSLLIAANLVCVPCVRT